MISTPRTERPGHPTRFARSDAPAAGVRSIAASERSSGWTRTLEQWIADHPALCLGAAVAAGVTIGWFIKRR
jgi:hypothetical protein